MLVSGLRTIFDNLRPIVQLLALAKGAAAGARAGGVIGGVLGGTGAVLGVSLALDALEKITPAAERAQRPIRGMADAYRLLDQQAATSAGSVTRSSQVIEQAAQRFGRQGLPSLATPGTLFRPGEAPAAQGEQFFDLEAAQRFDDMLTDLRQNAADLGAGPQPSPGRRPTGNGGSRGEHPVPDHGAAATARRSAVRRPGVLPDPARPVRAGRTPSDRARPDDCPATRRPSHRGSAPGGGDRDRPGHRGGADADRSRGTAPGHPGRTARRSLTVSRPARPDSAGDVHRRRRHPERLRRDRGGE